MYASHTGLNWYTADRAELTVFNDCARITLRWNDGAYAYDILDTEAEAREALRRYGFDVDRRPQ